MKLGRAEIRNGPGGKAGPSRFDQTGDRIQLQGVLYPATDQNEPGGVSLDRSRAFRQQWLALDGDAADVVPLWFPDGREDIWDASGFYRVTSTQCSVMPAVTETQGVLEYRATLERVADGYASALVEQYLTGVLRPNTSGVVSAQQIVGFPVSTYSSEPASDVVGSASGPIERETYLTGAPIRSAEYRCKPEDFYNGAASVEVRYSANGSWFPIEGLQATTAATAQNTRITNGRVRVSLDPGAGFVVESWVPGADPLDTSAGRWSDPVTVTSTDIDGSTPVRILSLSPTSAAVEYYSAVLPVSVSVQRADRFAHFVSAGSGLNEIEIKRNGIAAPGQITVNLYQETTAGDDGGKWTFGAPDSSVSGAGQPESTAVDGVVAFAVHVAAAGLSDASGEYHGISRADQSVVS